MTATAIRPAPMARETFEAFVLTSGPLAGIGSARPLGDADSLEAAVALASAHTAHKAYFAIRQTDTFTGAALLKFYVIRKAKPVRRYHDFQTKLVADSYAEHLFDLREGAI